MATTTKKPTIQELLGKQEPLCAELQRHLYRDEHLGPCIKHPLLFSVPHMEPLNAMCNKRLEWVKDRVATAKLAGNFGAFIMFHERPYRWDALQELDDDLGLDNATFWELFGEVWIDSENIWQHFDWIADQLRDDRPGKENIMDAAERKAFAALPDMVTLYRGHQVRNRHGLSWTLDYSKAEWFAKRFQSKRWQVDTRSVPKDHLVALLLGRGEQEIIWVAY